MKAEFSPTTRIDKACDLAGSPHYATDGVLVTPSKDGVFLSATDASIAAITQEKGTVHSGHPIVPAEVLPKKAGDVKRCRQGEAIQVQGDSCYTPWGKTERAINDRKFPMLASLIPQVDTDEFVTVTLDTNRLRNMLDALDNGETNEGVSLMIHIPDNDTKQVSTAVCVLLGDNIGVIMPLCTDDGRNHAAERFNEIRNDYEEALSDSVHDTVLKPKPQEEQDTDSLKAALEKLGIAV